MKFGMNAEWPVKQHAVRILAAIKHPKLVVALQSVSQDVNVPQEQSMKEVGQYFFVRTMLFGSWSMIDGP